MRIIPILLLLAACATPPPAVSDIDGDHVKLQGIGQMKSWDEYNLAEFDVEAEKACAIYGKQPSEALSVRALPNYRIEVLYACR